MAVPDGTIAGSSADFTANGTAIVYSQTSMTSTQTSMYNLSAGTVQTLLASTTGDVTLRTDGRMYLSQAGQNSMIAYEQDMVSNYPVNLTTTLTGSLAQKTYKAQPAASTEHLYARLSGLKKYELKDHLGNVRVVFSDLKSALNQGGTLVNDAKITAYYNYYPFGMQMPGRYSPPNLVGQNGYRYGFQGQEKDDDWTGVTGINIDYKYRIYDSRIGRFMSVDPLTTKYPSNSTYSFSENKVINGIEMEGLEWVLKIYSPSVSKNFTEAFNAKDVYRERVITLWARTHHFKSDDGLKNLNLSKDSPASVLEFDPNAKPGVTVIPSVWSNGNIKLDYEHTMYTAKNTKDLRPSDAYYPTDVKYGTGFYNDADMKSITAGYDFIIGGMGQGNSGEAGYLKGFGYFEARFSYDNAIGVNISVSSGKSKGMYVSTGIPTLESYAGSTAVTTGSILFFSGSVWRGYDPKTWNSIWKGTITELSKGKGFGVYGIGASNADGTTEIAFPSVPSSDKQVQQEAWKENKTN